MFERTRVIVSPEENSSVIIKKMKEDGWAYKGANMAMVMNFERPLPDSPSSALVDRRVPQDKDPYEGDDDGFHT